ncbi:endonuclease III domain-containing protein [Runella slithyformis]|uniref:DNA-(Apurinic or apyrimidinic site) lyase n=1 Tax=Runella slithyformis (strain ATCC 29530 / DSM 19594 / LMG 11500 / NCIMB 11436 / LSU 4) TaxID=761193 RepID=A0A7U3ZMA8_RUNSL|nr:DNA-(apurinic or apyrimidinic site) lyase [Runella slithyformis]AEI49802.1 DNA-(apurinic or apyrimidinic site) lyase [Runella slithyformis DSM 19594]
MKLPFDLTLVLARIEESIRAFPKAAMFELAERGYSTLFEQLISCIISIRTLDETTIPVSLRLFAAARTPEELLRLTPEQLTELLYGATYPDQKAYTMLGIAKAAVEQYDHRLPADYDSLTALKGVGPKCANLALGVATGQAAISVDIHVHRVVNRWGYVQANQPEKTLKQLEAKVPVPQWIEINRLLMPFGKHICTGTLPRCSTCPVLAWCEQVGVTQHR